MQWVSVVGYGGYQVSDTGEVMSFKRSPNGLLLKQIRATGGYLAVKLNHSNNRKMVHRLVLEAFVGPCPEGMEGCHNNGNPADNRLSNLRWDTKSANAFDTVAHGSNVNSGKANCPSGHPYDDKNTRWSKTSSGMGRQCRECDRLKNLAKRAANRDAYNAEARERRRRNKGKVRT